MRKLLIVCLLFLAIASSALASSTTWDPANTGGFIVLSNGNLTISPTGSTTLNLTVTVSRQTSGKYYNEINGTTVTSDRIGIKNLNQTGFLGNDSNGIGWGQDGSVYLGNTNIATVLTYSSTHKLQEAVDIGNKLIWFNVDNATGTGTPGSGSGGWNNNNGNPATGVGGISLAAFTGLGSTPVGVGAMPFTNGDSLTGVFASGSWSFSAPSGFVQWPGPTSSACCTSVIINWNLPAAANDNLTLNDVELFWRKAS